MAVRIKDPIRQECGQLALEELHVFVAQKV
jgi:hypothetical protein